MKSMVIAFVLIPFHLVTLTPLSAQTVQNYDQFFLEAMVQRQKGNHDAAFDLLRHCRDLIRLVWSGQEWHGQPHLRGGWQDTSPPVKP